MPKFSVTGVVTGSKWLGDFEADTAEQAIEMAMDSEKNHVSLCHQCNDQCEDPEIHEAIASELPAERLPTAQHARGK